MTADDLSKIAERLYGARGWHAKIAARLGVHRTTVLRWAAGKTRIPHMAQMIISGMKKQ